MTQAVAAQPSNAATDPRIDPQVRSFFAELNKIAVLFGNCRNLD